VTIWAMMERGFAAHEHRAKAIGGALVLSLLQEELVSISRRPHHSSPKLAADSPCFSPRRGMSGLLSATCQRRPDCVTAPSWCCSMHRDCGSASWSVSHDK